MWHGLGSRRELPRWVINNYICLREEILNHVVFVTQKLRHATRWLEIPIEIISLDVLFEFRKTSQSWKYLVSGKCAQKTICLGNGYTFYFWTIISPQSGRLSTIKNLPSRCFALNVLSKSLYSSRDTRRIMMGANQRNEAFDMKISQLEKKLLCVVEMNRSKKKKMVSYWNTKSS